VTIEMLANIVGPDGLVVIVVVVVVLLFGGSQLPKLARGLGSASHEFKKGIKEGDLDKGDSSTSKAKGDDKGSGPIQSN